MAGAGIEPMTSRLRGNLTHCPTNTMPPVPLIRFARGVLANLRRSVAEQEDPLQF